MAVATSGGIRRFHRDTALHLQVIAQTGDGSGWADWYGREPVRLDPAGVVDRAADIARRARNPVAAPSGPLDVVLAPAAVAALVEWMALGSFGARGVLDGTSLLAGREGELLCSPRITLREGVGPGEPPFDSEGVTRRPVDFLRAGCGGRPVSDLLTAARLGHAEGSTGHAQPLSLHASAADPTPGHAILEPGGLAERDLIAMVDRGLYVTRFHYVNGLLDTRRATMTGMTRDGTFLIEKGTLTRPVVNLRFTDSILDALSEPRLGGIGKDLVLSPTWYTAGGEISTPALLLRRLQFGPPAVSR
jgi:predicted Zn-dependent protease